MKTFDKPHIRVLDHLLGRDKHLSVFFPNSLYMKIEVFFSLKHNSTSASIAQLAERLTFFIWFRPD